MYIYVFQTLLYAFVCILYFLYVYMLFLETETLMSNCFSEVKPTQVWNAFSIRLVFGVLT